jgi:phospholipid/cholesterol/gamma-HCH transport system permease protein
MITWTTNRIIGVFESLGRYLMFVADTVKWTFRKPFDSGQFLEQMLVVGNRSFPVTGITIFFTGMVMALQIGGAMDALMPGSSMYTGSAVTIAMFRELAPVLTALLLAGRIGSAIAAQIGTMKVTEQLDAMVTLSTEPVQYIAVPRFLACLVMVPTLTILSDLLGVLGGGLVAFFSLGITPETYIDNVINFTSAPDFVSGIVKSVFFGAEIATIACYEGFKTTGGAEGVGRSTIRAVVKSSMAVLISDYFLTQLLKYVNL